MKYLVFTMATIFLFTCIHISCLDVSNGAFIFSTHILLELSTQKEPDHCDLYSLIYIKKKTIEMYRTS